MTVLGAFGLHGLHLLELYVALESIVGLRSVLKMQH